MAGVFASTGGSEAGGCSVGSDETGNPIGRGLTSVDGSLL